MATQFGEIPLHLAVDCGATPEVVNLLIVAYWDGIVACDQSGRTPMDILNSNEMLALEEHRVVFESLERCHKAYTSFQKRAAEEVAALKNKHKATFLAVKRRHDDDIKAEHARQDQIHQQVKELEMKVDNIYVGIRERDATIDEYKRKDNQWKDHVKELDDTIAELHRQLKEEVDSVETLMKTVDLKDEEILKREMKIEMLSEDLRQVLLSQERDVADRLKEAERSMRAMVSTQIALQNQLVGQKNGLKQLLKQRGIEFTPPPEKTSELANEQEEKVHRFEEEEIDTNEAANAAAAAALSALQQTPQRALV